MIFSQNARAESWYNCCSLSYPLLTPAKGELSGPGDMSCSLEWSAKPKPTSDPGWEVSPRWLWLIQSCKEAETSPHPNLTRQQEVRNLLSHGNASSASTQGESCWWRWEGNPMPQEDLLLTHRDRHFAQKRRTRGKCSWPRSPIHIAQGQEGLTWPLSH